MIKNILFDIDGIVIHREMYFSSRFLKDYGITEDKVQPFFQNEFKNCIVGKADLKEEIQKYFKVWNWNESVDQLLKYWFESESSIDQKVLDLVEKLRRHGIRCFLQTKNEKYRATYIWETLGLKNHFDGIFASWELQCKKPEMEFWGKISKRLPDTKKEEVLVWDNEQEIIDSAKKFGFQTKLYTDFESFQKTLESFLRS